ncbi:hypothetical protein [Bosea sp. 117]|uniref:anti-sigma factor family protein n=1 Tax=Bosea sp. 117 TaxID=1125973 RepID=UPI0004940927|nr:hypothetical protein [Bosea sp. 117]
MNGRDDNRVLSDAELAAFMDGELDAERRREIERMIGADPEAGAMLREMTKARDALRGSFDGLPPLPEHLRGFVTEVTAPGASMPRVAPRHPRRGVLALAGFALLAATFLLGVWFGARNLPGLPATPGGELAQHDAESADDWRDAVAAYLALHTPETFRDVPADDALRGKELATVGARLGLDLAPGLVTLPGLTLKRSQLFDYDGLPLAQIAYVDDAGEPVALCVVKASGSSGAKAEAPSFEELHGLNVYHWSAGRHGFMVAGRIAPERLRAMAEQLQARLPG